MTAHQDLQRLKRPIGFRRAFAGCRMRSVAVRFGTDNDRTRVRAEANDGRAFATAFRGLLKEGTRFGAGP